jgi:hypothetical protein
MPKDLDDSGGSGDELADLVTRPLLRRLEHLTGALLGARFGSADEFWQFQLKLLELQRAVQSEINRVRSSCKTDRSRPALSSLRAIRWHSRRLGDAYAWAAMGLDRKILYPLSENSRIPISPENHGSRGVLAVASQMASRGWGFPLMHDVTDCLRIGDVTFVQNKDPSRVYHTVEVKTHLKEERPGSAKNLMSYEYEVQVTSLVPIDPETGLAMSWGDLAQAAGNPPQSTGSRRLNRRLGRQTRRMHKAYIHQTAPDNELTEIEGEPPLLSTNAETVAPSYWKSLRRVIRQARKEGYGSEVIEGAFLYSAFYDPSGLQFRSLNNAKMLSDLETSGILMEDQSQLNSLIINAIPPQEQTRAHNFLPFYLYHVPRRAIYDLINGRLVVTVVVNQGKVLQGLEAAGFEIVKAPSRADRSLIVAGYVENSSGVRYRIEVPALSPHLNEMIYEFYGIDYLIGIANSILQAAAKVFISDLLAETR